MLPVVFRAEALDDLVAAARWYDERLPGLGRDFIAAVEAKLELLSRNPRQYQRVRGPIRRAITRHFPYGIFFVEDGDQITVLAVLHHARHPKHWQTLPSK